MRKHSHYFKDVSKLGEIDVYRVCDLFQINDPSGATQHALKKILLPGLRGGKCTRQDMQEAIDTLTRRIQMLDEDTAYLLPGMGSAGIPADFGQSNTISYPATPREGPDVSFDGDSPRMQAIAQNGNDGAHYSEIDRLRAAADFNDDIPVEPQRPRHVCPACGLGHSIGQCNPMTLEEAVALCGKPITEVAE